VIFLEKNDDREFLFGVELRADLEVFVRITVVSWNLLVVFILRYSFLLIVHLLIGGQLGGG
jgi:hypothetical protein